MLRNISKRTYLGVTLSLLGWILNRYGEATTFVDETGRMHESFATPLGALLIIFGLFVVFSSLIIKKRK